jgi:hypothetical protein
MEWLLTLFAMLGAVTGGLNGVRGDEARLHAAEAATAVQVVVQVSETAVAPLALSIPAATLLSTEVAPLADVPPIAAGPLYADRLIE